MTAAPVIGFSLSHFRITAKLGQGGMGEVYRAEDTRLGRPVAIKVLPEEVAGEPDQRARFEREARVLASLNHPHIAAIYALESATPAGREPAPVASDAPRAEPAPDPVHFLVMELVEGEDLQARLARGGLSIPEVLSIARQVADALGAAHAREIMHRDLKPANIQITPAGDAKVLDFGLARRQSACHEAGGDLPTASLDALTRQDHIVGTVPYMSPEQIRARPLDVRTDIFSLGVVMFEMLAGRRPFDGETSVDVMSAILREPPSALKALRPDVPAELERLIEDCLAKDAGRRPASARAVGERLARIAAALEPSRPSGAHRPSSSAKDAGLDPRVIAVLPFETLSGAEEAGFLATGLHNDLITELSRVAGLTIISRSSVLRYQGTDKTTRQIGLELAAGTLIQGTVQSAGNRVRLTAELIDAAADVQRWAERCDGELSTDTLFDLQSEVTRKIVDSLQSRLSPTLEVPRGRVSTHDLEVYRLVTLGRVQVERRTREGCTRAIDHFRAATARDPACAAAWAGLAEALAIAVWYGYAAPADRLEQALQAARRAVELDPDSAEAHGALGTCLGAVRHGPMAMRELERAVELQPSYWEAHNLLSYLHHLNGQARESLERARRAAELNPLSAEAANHVSLSLLTMGDAEGALAEARRASELSPGWTTAFFYEALALHQLARFGDAAARLDGLTVEWAGGGAEATLALTHLAAGDRPAARRVLDALDPERDRFAAGLVHLALGDPERAFERFGATRELTDWACLATHYLYRDVWAPVERDARYLELVRRALAAHGFTPQEGTRHD